MSAHAEWLIERRNGIGGSDHADLFELDPEGCRRRLGYDKLGIPPDYPEEITGLMRRGTVLEDAAAAEYTRKTGRKVRRVTKPIVQGWARVNIDRYVPAIRGPLEIKTHGAYAFQRVKRQGMREAHVLQLQHAIWLRKAEQGAFAVLHPDSWELLHFDVPRDNGLIEIIERRGAEFWRDVIGAGMLPAKRFPADEPRCRSCPWRRTCQGADAAIRAALSPEEQREELPRDEAFTEMVTDHAIAQEAYNEAQRTLELVRNAIKAKLGSNTAVSCSGGRIYYREQSRSQLDTKALRAEHADIYEQYTRPVVSRPLRVFPGIGGKD